MRWMTERRLSDDIGISLSAYGSTPARCHMAWRKKYPSHIGRLVAARLSFRADEKYDTTATFKSNNSVFKKRKPQVLMNSFLIRSVTTGQWKQKEVSNTPCPFSLSLALCVAGVLNRTFHMNKAVGMMVVRWRIIAQFGRNYLASPASVSWNRSLAGSNRMTIALAG